MISFCCIPTFQLRTTRTNYQMCLGLGTAVCAERLRAHWISAMNESDWQWIRNQVITAKPWECILCILLLLRLLPSLLLDSAHLKPLDALLFLQGLNSVRLPIPYWLTQTDKPDFPFPSGGHVFLDWAFKMAGQTFGVLFLFHPCAW